MKDRMPDDVAKKIVRKVSWFVLSYAAQKAEYAYVAYRRVEVCIKVEEARGENLLARFFLEALATKDNLNLKQIIQRLQKDKLLKCGGSGWTNLREILQRHWDSLEKAGAISYDQKSRKYVLSGERKAVLQDLEASKIEKTIKKIFYWDDLKHEINSMGDPQEKDPECFVPKRKDGPCFLVDKKNEKKHMDDILGAAQDHFTRECQKMNCLGIDRRRCNTVIRKVAMVTFEKKDSPPKQRLWELSENLKDISSEIKGIESADLMKDYGS